MGFFDAITQTAKAATRAAVTPVVVLKDVANVLTDGDLETPEHLGKIAKDVTDIPDKLDD